MYIEPNSTIKLCHNVPLDKTYDHTIYFPSEQNRLAYFNQIGTGNADILKYTFTKQSYQRVRKGVIRVERKADDLYDCNYLLFQNTAYGNKWFYAFIKSVEYINDVTSEIEFQLDVMQTWDNDYTLDYCYIERQHSETDEIGEHIEPEPVDCGEYISNGWEQITSFSSDEWIIIACVDVSDPNEWVGGKIYDGVYGGLTLYGFKYTEVDKVNAFIAVNIQSPDRIQNIYIAPDLFPDENRDPEDLSAWDDYILPENIVNDGKEITLTALSGSETLNGYTPKNKKLYTYPYNFYHVDNLSGQGLDVRYEFFYNHTPKFLAFGTLTQPVRVVMRPENYKGSGGLMNFSESITLENYPQCSWNMDAYWAWVAQNAVPEMGHLAKSGIGALGFILGNKGAAISTILSSAINVSSQGYEASIQADIIKGNTNSGNVNVASGFQDFYGTRLSVNAVYARRIDDFFTRFGYALGIVAIPNRNARQHYTYIKTAGCTISGSIPADDMRQICEIYDNGITWWRVPYEVGNYSVNNAVWPPVVQGGE